MSRVVRLASQPFLRAGAALRSRLRVTDEERDAESVRLLAAVLDGIAAGNRLLLVDQHVAVPFARLGVSAVTTVRELRDIADGLELWGGAAMKETCRG